MTSIEPMHCPFYWVDAFTSRPFGGNPAGVCVLDAWPDDALLQRIAWQNGLAETAYVVRTGAHRYHLRWFTPELEIDLCGHATLATAHALWREERLPTEPLTFDTRSGPLEVVPDGDRISMNFPARAGAEIPPELAPAALVQGLRGTRVKGLAKARDYLCVLEDAATVRHLQPDFAALADVPETLGIIVTAPGDDCDFVSRFFAPAAGIPEDPVTGSSHCTLVPYWAQRLNRPRLHARQVSARGGELWCELRADRVHLTGHAVTYIRGRLEV